MQMLAHRAVGVELPQRGGLRAGAAQRVDHLPASRFINEPAAAAAPNVATVPVG
jgi:hypothetical protein